MIMATWLEGDKKYSVIVTLDVQNTFYSADWDATLAPLDGKDVPNYLFQLVKDYLRDRVLLYDTDDDRKLYGKNIWMNW